MDWLDLAAASVRLYAAADRAITRGQSAVRGALGGLLASALTDDELDRLTDAMYRAAGPVNEQGLFEWERLWFEAALPPPPGRVLLGGAGYGREAVPLQARGYQVHTFEPEPSAVHTCRDRLNHDHVFCARYRDLATGLEGQGPLASLGQQRFDAAIFGWGSFSHLRHPFDRRQALASMAAVTEGPVLLSFVQPPPTDSRVPALASAAGAWLARARGQPLDAPRDLWFAPWCGFLARVTRAEVDELARELGRRVDWGPAGAHSHATLTLAH